MAAVDGSFAGLRVSAFSNRKDTEAAKEFLQEFLEDESEIDLDLSDCRIEALPESYFADPQVAKRLRNLDCFGNLLKDLPASLGSCANLKILQCFYNRLTKLPPSLGACVGLKRLDCTNNQLKELPSELGACVNLKYLNCSANKLTNLPPELGACAKLETLSCGMNQLTDLPLELGQCVNLKTLWCCDNPLTEGAPRTPKDLQEQWAHTKSAEKT